PPLRRVARDIRRATSMPRAPAFALAQGSSSDDARRRFGAVTKLRRRARANAPFFAPVRAGTCAARAGLDEPRTPGFHEHRSLRSLQQGAIAALLLRS